MKILVVDYLSYKGHQNFNKIHIDSLIKQGYSLLLAGRKGQFNNIPNDKTITILEMPEWLFLSYPYPAISVRVLGILKIIWLLLNSKTKGYETYLFLTYDILSLFVLRTTRKVILVNHNNVSQLNNRIKLWLTRKLPKHYIHIALNEDMQERLSELQIKNKVFYVPHGICKPSLEYEKPSFICDNERFLFCPINSNYDKEYVKELLESSKLHKCLDEMRMNLYIKISNPICVKSKNIITIENPLPNCHYNYMLQNAQAVILIYDSSLFQYRCSGIFFECLSRKTPIIATDIKSMSIYKDKVKTLSLFSNIDDFLYSIMNISKDDSIDYNKIFDPYTYWESVLGNEKMK